METSKLIVLGNGQIVGYPITRRELKRQLRQAKLSRRATYRALRRSGLSYVEAATAIKMASNKGGRR